MREIFQSGSMSGKRKQSQAQPDRGWRSGSHELLQSALEREECPEEFFTMKATAERQPNDVLFGTFHVWAQTDVN